MDENVLMDYLVKNQILLKDPDHYFGAWLNNETGMVHLDVSMIVDTEEEAQTLGLENKQLAFFDLAGVKEISVIGMEPSIAA